MSNKRSGEFGHLLSAKQMVEALVRQAERLERFKERSTSAAIPWPDHDPRLANVLQDVRLLLKRAAAAHEQMRAPLIEEAIELRDFIAALNEVAWVWAQAMSLVDPPPSDGTMHVAWSLRMLAKGLMKSDGAVIRRIASQRKDEDEANYTPTKLCLERLPLGAMGERQRRHQLDKITAKWGWVRRKRGCINEEDFLKILRMLKSLSLSKTDVSDAVDELPEIEPDPRTDRADDASLSRGTLRQGRHAETAMISAPIPRALQKAL